METKQKPNETAAKETAKDKPPETGPSKEMLALFQQDPSAMLRGAKLKDLSLPDFIEPDSMPVGSSLVGRVIEVVGDFTGNPDMKDCKNLVMQVAGTTKKIMFPITGELGQSLLRIPGGGDGFAGKTLAIRRGEDRMNKKFKNRQFHLETVLVEFASPEVERAMFPLITK